MLGIESQPLNDGEAHLRVFFQAGAVIFEVVFFGPKQKNHDLQPKNRAWKGVILTQRLKDERIMRNGNGCAEKERIADGEGYCS